MSAYRKRWIEILKNQQKPDWNIDEHGQAIVIRVPEDRETLEKQIPALITGLSSHVEVPPEWLKFIFYNEKARFEYILNPGLRVIN